jgi:hypothetical protein
MAATRPKIPLELRWLACVNLAVGVTAAINMVLGIVKEGIRGFGIDFGVLYLFVGWGLLGLFRGARTQALWLTIVVPVVLAPIALITGNAQVHINGQPASTLTTVLVWIAFAVLLVWDLRVLTSKRVKDLYRDEHFLDRFARARADE